MHSAFTGIKRGLQEAIVHAKGGGRDMWVMSERAPWRNFPEVRKACNLKLLQSQPEYALAKTGSENAALALANRFLDEASIANIKTMNWKLSPCYRSCRSG